LWGVPGVDSPTPRSYNLAQNAAFAEGDIVRITTVGTIVTPSGGVTSGGTSMVTQAGPSPGQNFNVSSTAAQTANNVTITGVVSAGAAAASYYVILTYTNTTGSNESLSGIEFIVNCAAGYTFSTNVLAAGAPAAALTSAVYIGTYPGGEALQQATKYTTVFGVAFTTPVPLTNNAGINRAVSNSNTFLAGIAMADAYANFAVGVGGAFTAGGVQNVTGAWATPYPLMPGDPIQALVGYVGGGQPIEICLLQPWFGTLQGAVCGLTLTAGGVFVADTTATAIMAITDKVTGSVADVGGIGDTYSRVKCVFTGGTI